MREKIVRERGGKLWKKAAFGAVLGRPQVERKLFALGRVARPLISKEGRVKVPLPEAPSAGVGMLRRLEMFPAPAERSFTALVAEEQARENAREKQVEAKKEVGGEGSKGQDDFRLHEVRKHGQEGLQAGMGVGKKVAIFPGCLIENFFPETGMATYRLLRRHGFEVEVPFDGCCGFPAANSGYVEEARKEFGRVAEKLLRGDYYRIIALCPTCTAMLRELGPRLMTEIMLDEEKAAVFKERVKTLVSFVEEEGLEVAVKYHEELGRVEGERIGLGGGTGVTDEAVKDGHHIEQHIEKAEKETAGGAKGQGWSEFEAGKGQSTVTALREGPGPEVGTEVRIEARPEPEIRGETTAKIKITYHDSCHHKFVLKEAEVSRRLLEGAGYELVEMEEADVCCGFAGVFSVERAAVSEALLRQKLEAIEKTGAEVVVMDCPGCLLQIKGGLLAGKKPVKVKHSAELL
ncbi:MAG TPA: hypothetical protein DCR87_06285 [Acidobacteria bacterium]|nr:hypothetical protein [Acidobacteriota bacterium]